MPGSSPGMTALVRQISWHVRTDASGMAPRPLRLHIPTLPHRPVRHEGGEEAGAGGEVGGGGALRFVMADAALAGHEDHAFRADPGQVVGVVPGARGDVHVVQTERPRLTAPDRNARV